MSTGFSKESPAMMRARELNRTNERRLSENIDELSLKVQKKIDKIKVEGETTLNFLRKVKMSSGFSQKSDLLRDSLSEEKSLLEESPRRMDFSKINYKKIKEMSKALEVKTATPAGSGNPIPVRKVHPWTVEAAKVLSRKSPSRIPHPTGRMRRHSVGSEQLLLDDTSDDDGSDITPLSRLKKRAGQKRLNAQLLRRTSLPTIGETNASIDENDQKRVDKNTIKASLVKLKKKRSFSC